jgi:hypothetical protein
MCSIPKALKHSWKFVKVSKDYILDYYSNHYFKIVSE